MTREFRETWQGIPQWGKLLLAAAVVVIAVCLFFLALALAYVARLI